MNTQTNPINPSLSEDLDILKWPYEIAPNQIVINITYDVVPESKARPRFANGHAYTPQKTRIYESNLSLLMQVNMQNEEPDAISKFGLRCIFYRPNRQRIDCDNLIKAISDAANKTVWKDDSQVVEIIGRLIIDSENPRAEILIYTVEDPSPKILCAQCGKRITKPSRNRATYCSMECKNKSSHVIQKCRQCGKDYERTQSTVKKTAGFCSRSCAGLFHGSKRTQAHGSSTWICQICGGPVSRKEYTKCRGCSMKSRITTSNYWKNSSSLATSDE